MNISVFSKQLRELTDEYSEQRITFDDYRTKRKAILDKIDNTMNNVGYPDGSEAGLGFSGIF